MHARKEMPAAPLSDVAGKYALLLKYSDKARAAELHMSSFPDDLRESFRREAVADPARIPEIAARFAAEQRKRSSRFGDPKLDTLYRKLESHGAEAQSEFQQVVELLKGEVDAEQVFNQIVGCRDRQPGKREVSSVVQLIETPQAIEQRRRRAEAIAGKIESLRLQSVANSNCLDEGIEPATQPQHRPIVAVPAMPRLPQRALAVACLSFKPPHWAAAAAAASVLVTVMSCVGFALMIPPTGAADLAHRPAAADAPRPSTQQEATVNVATTPDAESGKKAAEQHRAAEAAAPREEEIRLAKLEEDKTQAEASRELATAEAYIAARQAERRQAAESRPTPEAVEAGLNLSDRDHKRVQLALTALGQSGLLRRASSARSRGR